MGVRPWPTPSWRVPAPRAAERVDAAHAGAACGSPRTSPGSVINDVGHDLGHALGALRGSVPHVIPAVTALIPRPPSRLAGPVGPRRVWVSVDIPLAEVKSTGRALGATVNDVVLACVTGGFRDLLVHRGEPVEGRRGAQPRPGVDAPAGGRQRAEPDQRDPGPPAGRDRRPGGPGSRRCRRVSPTVGKPARRRCASALLGLVDRTVPCRCPGCGCRGGRSQCARMVHGHPDHQRARPAVPGVPVRTARARHVSAHPRGRAHLHHHRHLQLRRHAEHRRHRRRRSGRRRRGPGAWDQPRGGRTGRTRGAVPER